MRRPSTGDITRFLDASRELPLSYAPTGIVRDRPEAGRFDEHEEWFEVFIERDSGDVKHRIRAVSWPQSVLALDRPAMRSRPSGTIPPRLGGSENMRDDWW